MKNRLTLLLISLLVAIVHSNADSLDWHLNSQVLGLYSSGDINALYSYSNKYGIYNPKFDNQSLFHIKGEYSLLNNKKFSFSTGGGLVVNNRQGSSFLHEIYVKGHFWFIDYSIGKEAYSPLVINDTLSSGLHYWSTNSAPLPRAIFGIFNYLPLSFTNNWVQIKGFYSLGVLDDKRESYGKSYPLIMDQSFYLRMGKSWIKPYLSITHSAVFGGKDAKGNPIPVDFWATFFARGSAKVGGGDATNAAGAHAGFYDFGLFIDRTAYSAQVYLQKPIRDGSSLFLNHGNNKDFIVGVDAKIKGLKWLRGINIEAVKTTYQSGPGMLDIAYPKGHPKEGELIFPNEIDDYDQFMLDEFGMEVHGWGKEEFVNYFEQTYNHGYSYGGRDNYLNNGMYYKAWVYRDMVMGTPLFITEQQFNKFANKSTVPSRSFIINNRIYAFNIGLNGNVNKRISYLIKTTITNNFGAYQDEYQGAMSWDETTDYYFKEGLIQWYGYAELSINDLFIKKTRLSLNFGADGGEMYHTFSGGFTLGYYL